MPELSMTPPPTDWLRLSLLYSHLLLCSFALVSVLRADMDIAAGRFTVDGLRGIAHRTALVLLALWVSGLAIIWLDTGFDPATLAANPKLLLKLVTVLVLTANGVLLHYLSFPIIAGRARPTTAQTLLLTVTGALSTSHWLLAAFVGVARPLALWPIGMLLAGYLAYCMLTLLAATISVPVLRQRLWPDERVPVALAPSVVGAPIYWPGDIGMSMRCAHPRQQVGTATHRGARGRPANVPWPTDRRARDRIRRALMASGHELPDRAA